MFRVITANLNGIRSAAKKGFFAANNIEMEVVSIGVSPGMQAVASGSLDIMHNTCNAPISFYEGGGANVRISMVSMSTHPAQLVGKKGMKSAGKSLELHRYDAEHGFANEQRLTVHDRQAAELAWGRAAEYFAKHLG